jgi:hypothetical protein
VDRALARYSFPRLCHPQKRSPFHAVPRPRGEFTTLVRVLPILGNRRHRWNIAARRVGALTYVNRAVRRGTMILNGRSDNGGSVGKPGFRALDDLREPRRGEPWRGFSSRSRMSA